MTHVDRIELGVYGWRVHASISNRSASPLPIENVEKPPLPGATAGPQAYPRQPTSLLVRGPDQFGGTILQVHAATDYQPQLPRVLRPHQMWRGTFAGVGKVPSGALFYAGFGQFESNGQLISISSAKSATAP